MQGSSETLLKNILNYSPNLSKALLHLQLCKYFLNEKFFEMLRKVCGGSNPATDRKTPKCIYKISKNFRVEKSREISRNLRFSRFFVPASKSDTHHGWDSWTRTSEMQESKSCALPTWLYPNIFLVIFYHTKKTMSIQKSRRSGIFVFEIISALIFRRELYSPFCQA